MPLHKPFHLIICMALLLGLAGPAALPFETASLHPLLAQLAREAPNDLVSVIVQTLGDSESAQLLALEHGAKITSDLYFINAFAAEMPAAAASQLSEHGSVRWVSPDATMEQMRDAGAGAGKGGGGGKGGGDKVSFITWANEAGSVSANEFTDTDNMLDSIEGPNGTYACSAGKLSQSVGGFAAEITPGYEIEKVEVLLHAYVMNKPKGGESLRVHVYMDGVDTGIDGKIDKKDLEKVVGAEHAGEIVVDISKNQDWNWSDFNRGVQLVFDHAHIKEGEDVCYDAIGIRVTSKTGPNQNIDVHPTSFKSINVDENKLENVYPFSVQAVDVWNDLQGQGLSVAVVDSGFHGRNKDLDRRVILSVNFNSGEHSSKDSYGHGTLVAGLIAGDGKKSRGAFVGIAPCTNIIKVRVSDDNGMSTESDVIESLQWIFKHRYDYNIRVVNLSLNSSMEQVYHVSPLNAALEVLWFNGGVVVVSGGNGGSGILYPPANDPFVISVGAADDMGTPSIDDDVLASFSAYGVTESGYTKPDIVAPGVDLISYLPDNGRLVMGKDHPSNRVGKDEFRVSGTSFSAPLVSGAIALLLQDEPGLTPDQVKYRLMATAAPVGFEGAGAGYLDIYAAVHGDSTESANTGIEASQLLWSGDEPVNWNSVNWNSVNWNSVNWNSDHWDD